MDDDDVAFREKQREDQKKLDGKEESIECGGRNLTQAFLKFRCEEEGGGQRSNETGKIMFENKHFPLSFH